MKPFNEDNVRECETIVKNGLTTCVYKDGEKRLGFERCIEIPWLLDKIQQAGIDSVSKIFDFGCNKAEYLLGIKKEYGCTTYGIDAKPEGRKYVDHFYHGLFDAILMKKINAAGMFNICSAISAIEHAGYAWHPNEHKITEYQKSICEFLIRVSNACFFTFPFGRRPGWPKDLSRRNLYQFNGHMLDFLREYAYSLKKNYLEEIYKFDHGYWIKDSRESSSKCRYRGQKSGAAAVALISVYAKSN